MNLFYPLINKYFSCAPFNSLKGTARRKSPLGDFPLKADPPLTEGVSIFSFFLFSFFLFVTFLSDSLLVSAQTAGIFGSTNLSLNTTGVHANTSSIFDISSTTKGLLIPRMTAAQLAVMNPLPAAAQGLLVYQTDGTQGFYYNTSTTTTPTWVLIAAGTQPWSKSGGNVFLTTGTDKVGLGTASPLFPLDVRVEGAGVYAEINIFHTAASSSGSDLRIGHGRGTQASPSAIPSGDFLGELMFMGQYGTSVGDWAAGAKISALSESNFTSSSAETKLVFKTTPSGSTNSVDRMTISGSGNVLLNAYTTNGIVRTTSGNGTLSSSGGAISLTSEVTGTLPIGNGGTGATTTISARANLSAAAAGANTDITSLTGLTTPLSLSQGGTNANLTAVNGGAVYSSGTAMAITAAGASGQVLTSNGAAAPTWQTLPAGANAWTKSGSNIYQTTLTDYVGIGINAPTNFLNIEPAAPGAIDLLKVKTVGTGRAGYFEINNAANASPALGVTTNGTGNGGEFQISNSASAVYAANSGGGNAVYGLGSGSGNVIYGKTTGTGMAGVFELSNAALSADAVFVNTNGQNSKGLEIRHSGTGGISTNHGIYSSTEGARGAGSTNVGGYFTARNATNNYALQLGGSTSGTLSISPAAVTTDYSIAMPMAQGAASTLLQNDGAGNLSWASASGLVRWDQIAAPTAGLTLAHGTNVTNFSFTNTTTDAFTLSDNSLTSGKILSLASTATGMTGSLASIVLSGSNVANTGDLLTLNSSGAASIAKALNVTVASTGNLNTTGGVRFNFSGAHTGTGFVIDDATASGTAVAINANSLSSGTGLILISTSTSGTGGASSYMLNIARTGANANASHSAYGVNSSVTNTGTTNTNYGGNFSASGATTSNYGIQGTAGGAGTSANFGVNASNSATGSGNQFGVRAEKIGNTGTGTGYGIYATATGTGTTNYGGWFSASGASQNIALRATGSNIALRLDGSTSGTLDISPAAVTTSYALTMPAAQGAASTFLQNDGAGNLSWTTSGTLTSGTANYIPKWTSATALSSTSLLYENGTSVGIGTTSPPTLLSISNGFAPMFSAVVNPAATTAGTVLGAIYFSDSQLPGTAQAGIYGDRDAVSSGATDLPTRLEFLTTADGSSSPGVKMVIKNDGSVGIGTTAPASMLSVGSTSQFQINSSGAIAAATGISSSGTINFSGLTASTAVYTDASKNLTSTVPASGQLGYWSRTGTTLYNTNQSDNVGIGTTAPLTRLDVRVANVIPTATVPGNLNIMTTDAQAADVGASISLGGQSGTTYPLTVFGTIEGRKTSTANDFLYGYLTFRTSSSGTLYERMRITDNGNVGIATTTPGAKLTVGADLGGTAHSATFKTNAGTLGTVATNELALASIGFNSTNQSALGIRAYRTTAGSDWTTTAIGLGMDVDNTVRAGGASLWLHANANVGIGIANPGSPLTVYNSADPRIELNSSGSNYTYLTRLNAVWNGLTNPFIIQSNSSDIAIAPVLNSPSTGIVIKQGGNVGIGTTNPTSLLMINKSLANTTAPVFTIKNGTGGGASVAIDFMPADPVGGNAPARLRVNDNNYSGDFIFQTNNPGDVSFTTLTDRYTITNSGKTFINSTDNSYGQLQIGNATNNGEASMAFISGKTAFGGTPTSVNGDSYIWVVGANPYGIGGNKFGIGNKATGGTILTIQQNGYVGIGTTGPLAKLHVSGTTTASPTLASINQTVASIGAQRLQFSSGDVLDIGFLSSPSYGAWMQAGFGGSAENILLNPLGGNVGIGTTNPLSMLHLGNGGELRIYDAIGTRYARLFHSSGGNVHLDAFGGAAVYINWYAGANLHVGNGTSSAYGVVYAGAFTVSSSKRFKKEIVNTSYGLKEILQLQGKEFKYIHDSKNRKEVGFIAEEMDLVIPEIVYRDTAGQIAGIDYSKLSPVIVEAIKDQQKIIDSLQKEVGNWSRLYEGAVGSLQNENKSLKSSNLNLQTELSSQKKEIEKIKEYLELKSKK